MGRVYPCSSITNRAESEPGRHASRGTPKCDPHHSGDLAVAPGHPPKLKTPPSGFRLARSIPRPSTPTSPAKPAALTS